jgi:hypothetical protein
MNKIFGLSLLLLGLLVSSCAQKVTPASERNPSSDKFNDPWTTWSRDGGKISGLLVLSGIRKHLLNNNLHDPHINYEGYNKSVLCDEFKDDHYRSADGTCYNFDAPFVGAAGTAFGRNVPPEMIDADAKENLMVPNPKLVSQEFFTRDEFKPVPFLNMLAASWIQFMNHDWLTHGKNAEEKPYTVTLEGHANIPVERTQENKADEGQYKNEYGKTTINEVTHWWDGSQIYGSNQAEQNEVRSFSMGKMRTVQYNGKELLPSNPNLNIARNKQNQGHEVTGFRDNWWVGLSMLHHLFVKEHNAIADRLVKKYAKKDAKSGKWKWSDGRRVVKRIGFQKTGKTSFREDDKDARLLTDAELDEHVFQVARLVNAAVMAKIHTIEWTPAILSNKTLKFAMYANWYGIANPQTWSKLLKHIPGLNKTDWFQATNSGYLVGGIVGDKSNDFGVPYSITEEFTSVYRLHSLLPEALNLKKVANKNQVTAVAMEDTRNEKSYGIMKEYDLKDLFYSFGTQHPGQLVLNNFPKFMQDLKIPGFGNMDLAMVDVLRDRERGVPRYNQFRRAINLKPIKRYRDFFPADQALDARQEAILAKFNKVYGKDDNGEDNVEMIDLLVGTVAEEVRPEGFGFGETPFQIFILMASRRLMADKFYTDNYSPEYYTRAGLDWIDDEGYMHKVIARHMPELKAKMKGLPTAFAPWKE